MAIFLEMRAVGRGQFEVLHEGRVLCCSREPFLAGCRALLAAGHAAGAVVEIRHVGAVGYSMRGRLGRAAGLTVREDGRRGPEFTEYVPYDTGSRADAASPMRLNVSPVPQQPPDTEIAPAATAVTRSDGPP